MQKPHHDVTAIIMAGGKGSRAGALGRVLPKCLFPIAGKQTMLVRLVEQLQAAGIGRAVICCSAESFPAISAFVEEHAAIGVFPDLSIQPVECSSTTLGPLPALAEAIGSKPAPWHLLCLGDIFFTRSPFTDFLSDSVHHAGVDGCLLTGKDLRAADDAGTGAVACEGPNVHEISYRPFPKEPTAPRHCRRWTGSFFFRGELALDLQTHAATYHGAPFENWVAGLLARGARCIWNDVGPFINVNSAEDYEYLVSGISAPAEVSETA